MPKLTQVKDKQLQEKVELTQVKKDDLIKYDKDLVILHILS